MRKQVVCEELVVPLYGTRVFIAVFPDPASVTEASVRRVLGRSFDAVCEPESCVMPGLGRCWFSSPKSQAVALLGLARCRGHVILGALAHEAYHVTTYVANAAGLAVTRDADEALAYITEFVVDRAARLCQRHKIPVAPGAGY